MKSIYGFQGERDYGVILQDQEFIRALKELDIKSLLARSPQAKGCVERVNRTLQDRLVKEMRLRSINNIDDANEYLDEFLEKFPAEEYQDKNIMDAKDKLIWKPSKERKPGNTHPWKQVTKYL